MRYSLFSGVYPRGDLFSPRSASEQVDEKPGGSMARTLTQTGHRRIAYHRVSHTLCKLGGIGHEGPITAQGQAVYLL